MFFLSSSLNQLGKVNELLIKPDVSDLTDEKEEEDVVEDSVEEENGSKADCVYTATSLETALNLVITSLKSLLLHYNVRFLPVEMLQNRFFFSLMFHVWLCSFIYNWLTRWTARAQARLCVCVQTGSSISVKWFTPRPRARWASRSSERLAARADVHRLLQEPSPPHTHNHKEMCCVST